MDDATDIPDIQWLRNLVSDMEAHWRKKLATIRSLRVALYDSEAVGFVLFEWAAEQRRNWDRYLRVRFGYDWKHNKFLKRPTLRKRKYWPRCQVSPRTWARWDRINVAIKNRGMWGLANSTGVHFARMAHDAGQSSWVAAGDGVLTVLENSIVLDIGDIESVPQFDYMRLGSIVMLSGYAASNLGFREQKGGQNSLRRALDTESKAPRDVLHEELLRSVQVAWSEQPDIPNLKIFRNRVAKLIEHERLPSQREYPIFNGLERTAPALEEQFSALEEARKQLECLKSRAKPLTALQERIYALKLEDPPLTEEAIAVLVGKSRNHVKTEWGRTKEKLRRAAGL